jgi:tetratricopeptide (TPR) repeat protein
LTLTNRFESLDLKCVVIAASSTLRGLISSCLKELSFTNITTVPDIKTCIEVMETEPVAWIVSPNRDAETGHVLHLLQILDKNPALRATKISIIRDDDDSAVPAAFELGALSCHRFEPSRELCLAEFQTLVQRLERYQGDTTLVAAAYLGQFLLEKGEHQELKRFYNSMLQIYPNKSDILLDLARAHFEARDMEDGRFLLQQVLLTAPEKKDQVLLLSRSYLPGQTLEVTANSGLTKHFGFKTVLLLDSDQESLGLLQDLSRKIGFSAIHGFSDPLALMRWVRQNPKPDLVISEWQLPNIPGPVVLYKLRNRLDLKVPIIVTNKQISDRDSTWIRELDVSCLVPKPLIEKELFQAIVWTMQQSKGPSDLQSLKLKLKIASRTQDKELQALRHQFMQHAMLIESERLLMEAQLAYDAGCYLHAKKYALDSVRESGEPREALEILSKSLMKLREFDAALRCLENVNIISPYNVNYLCEIAECHLENGDDTKYESYLGQAKDLDPDAQVVVETEAKGAMKRGHTDTAKKLLQGLKSFKDVLAFMNNRAVALIQVGKMEEGLDLYRKALNALPDGQSEAHALLCYNLGLGFARTGRLKEASASLDAALATKNPTRLKKTQSLKMRVAKAISEGTALNFPSDKAPSVEDEKARLNLIRAIESTRESAFKVTRSDYCVHKIYRSLMDDTKALEVLATAPTFNPRGKLVKDYIHGISQVPGNFVNREN